MKLLKFYATWCGPCKVQTEYLKKVTGVDIEEINIEDEKNEDLVVMYKVRGVPKMVLLDDDGELLREFRGLTTSESVQEVIDFYNK